MFAIFAIAIGCFAAISGNPAYSSQNDQPSVLLVQGGTGAGSGSQGLGTGKKSPFGGDQPTSGDFSPNPSDATRSGSKPEDVDKTITGSEQPSGIGEKGSGQTRSTQERSGGQQPSASESMSKSAEKHGEGKTEKAMKDLQSQKPKNK